MLKGALVLDVYTLAKASEYMMPWDENALDYTTVVKVVARFVAFRCVFCQVFSTLCVELWVVVWVLLGGCHPTCDF